MKKENIEPKMIDSQRLSEILGLSQASCRKLARAGKIQYSMSGSRMVYDMDSVMRYIGR